MQNRLPNCRNCIHYYITHDVSYPYGCRAMDFKSRRLPVLDVLQISGEACLTFRPKPRRRPTKPTP